MSAPATPKRRKPPDGTVFLDMERARRVLAADHAWRMAGSRAAPCRCPKPWPMAGECVKCGRRVA